MAGGLLEHVDECVPDPAALLLRIGDVGERLEEPGFRVHHAQVHAQMGSEGLLHLLPLVEAQQAVVHENAGEPVADGAVHEPGGHGGIHTTGETADRLALPAEEGPDAPDLMLDEMAGRPIRRAAADIEQEVVEDLPTARRMRHLGVEQHPENRPRLVLKGRHRRIRARGGHAELGRRLLDPIAVTGPYRDAVLRLESPEEASRARVSNDDVGPPVFALPRRLDLAARQMRDELHAVANGEDRRAELEQLGVGGRRTGIEHGARAPGQDHPPGRELPDERDICPARRRMDLAVDVRLAHAPRDELGELGAVVEDQDAVHAWYHVVGSRISPRSRSSSVSRCRAM